MDNLTIAYIQSDLVWEDSLANLNKFENYFKQIEQADLVILPEMFNTGFTMNVKQFAQPKNGHVTQWLKSQALQNNFAIMGSTIISNEANYFNRLLMIYPCTELKWYDKRHLFRMGNEHQTFTAGERIRVFPYIGWRIRPLICYDLRFPVWSRNLNNYDLLVYVANWPAPRREVWKTLLKARAIENQCYVVGVNRIGKDGMNIEYAGDSMVINPKGEIISEVPEHTEGIGIATISLPELNSFRKKFPVHLDSDNFQINNTKS